MDNLSPVLILVIIVVLYLISSIKILAEYERGVIFRLGRVLGSAERSWCHPGVPAHRPHGADFAPRRSDGGASAGRGHAR